MKKPEDLEVAGGAIRCKDCGKTLTTDPAVVQAAEKRPQAMPFSVLGHRCPTPSKP